MSDTTEETTPDETEEAPAAFRVRDVFQFRRAKDEPEEPKLPPMPADPPTVPTQAAAPAARVGRADGGTHMPNWWDQDKTLPSPAPPSASDKIRWSNGVPHYTVCAHPSPHQVRNQTTNQLLAFWCAACQTQLPVPDDYDELTEVTKEKPGEEEGEESEEGKDSGPADEVPPSIRSLWGLKGSSKTDYQRPVYSKTPDERKKSLVEAWTGMSRKTRHLLYNGAALGAGFYLGVPQFFTAEVAYLVNTYDSWTDFYVCVWYGVALGIWALDYRTRNWFPLFALAARVPLVSMIVGVLLYGNPAA